MLTLILDGLKCTASNHRDNGVIFDAWFAISNNVDISLLEQFSQSYCFIAYCFIAYCFIACCFALSFICLKVGNPSKEKSDAYSSLR
jgi:hypothetical protein